MKNKMKFNLTKILFLINNKFSILTGDEVELFLNDNKSLEIRSDDITYYFNVAKLQKIMYRNNFDTLNIGDNEDAANEILSKHIVQRLMILSGKRVYSQIKSTDLS
ncbi:MAG: hypothetical protein K0R77_1435 [Chryseobacterium sp.]|jgi:hypothetical protein|uniref:hypothetical protein n=1 Tax=Chryseobacterium sp. TaxID=1871047 RepID=UPI00260C8E85|nr:hypothetical protein [Chryseobacterium sp.]MDF2552160.1 hypothetical protein [Chryseobacterium sp.]